MMALAPKDFNLHLSFVWTSWYLKIGKHLLTHNQTYLGSFKNDVNKILILFDHQPISLGQAWTFFITTCLCPHGHLWTQLPCLYQNVPQNSNFNLLLTSLDTLETEINVPRTFIDFWIFSCPYDPYSGPYVY